ncbi:DASH complex subunit dam1 [Malassezia brasiliensis]|uniref:DASH complex subunit DAM1 n=1 Tax=Malassezia brasiliensis TaxID=1821822 RepID=A0AAF0DUV7_9BASI|nr:DASH complex subunit dam1 [Malassezia brasiliensis]
MSAPRGTSTPIRRISSGSLALFSRSHTDAATPLSFLADDALPMLTEETAALQNNLTQLAEIDTALRTFNESFATFLYGIKMNAFCVEWPEAPSNENLARAQRRAQAAPSPRAPATLAPVHADDSYTTNPDESMEEALPTRASQRGGHGVRAPAPIQTNLRQGAKAGAASAASGRLGASTDRRPTASTDRRLGASTAAGRPAASTDRRPVASTADARVPKRIPLAVKRRREAFADDIIDTMPLEYRNGDASQRRLLHGVILALLSAGDQGVRVADVAHAPDMPAGKVNKVLIALLAANHVVRVSQNGVVYRLNTARHTSLP